MVHRRIGRGVRRAASRIVGTLRSNVRSARAQRRGVNPVRGTIAQGGLLGQARRRAAQLKKDLKQFTPRPRRKR